MRKLQDIRQVNQRLQACNLQEDPEKREQILPRVLPEPGHLFHSALGIFFSWGCFGLYSLSTWSHTSKHIHRVRQDSVCSSPLTQCHITTGSLDHSGCQLRKCPQTPYQVLPVSLQRCQFYLEGEDAGQEGLDLLTKIAARSSLPCSGNHGGASLDKLYNLG